jgi:hypothetical protein
MKGSRMMTEDQLENLFAAARAEAVVPPDGLTARVLGDAVREQRATVAPAPAVLARPGLWAKLSAVFGGTGALAGLATAAVAGFYIGFAQPMEGGLVVSVLGGEVTELDMMPGIDALLDEAP